MGLVFITDSAWNQEPRGPDRMKADLKEAPNQEELIADKWPSYTLVEDRMKRIYFQFYRESYRKSEISRKNKELIALAASLGFRCEGCLNGHLKKALDFGATKEEISEAISIAMGVAAASVVDQTDLASEKLKIKHFA